MGSAVRRTARWMLACGVAVTWIIAGAVGRPIAAWIFALAFRIALAGRFASTYRSAARVAGAARAVGIAS